MEPNGFIELEMGSVGSNQPGELSTSLNNSVDETNMSTITSDGLDSSGQTNVRLITLDGLNLSGQHQDIVPEFNGLLEETNINEVANTSLRGKFKKDNGLRSKRGGKALKISVFSPLEAAERRRSNYAVAMAANAPLYPLDLQEHGVDSSQEDESDRSSSFSPEVAANGFGSPIELPSRDSFDDLTRRYMDNQEEMATPLDEIPLTRKFDEVAERHGGFDEDMLEDKSSEPGLSGKSFTKFIIKTVILILLWYTLSTLLVMYNKRLLGKDDHNFPAPLLMNTIHFSMQGIIATILVRCFPSMRPSVPMSWKDYFMRAVPAAVTTALDVDLTNVSLVFVSVSFETMCKSGSPIFLLIFAFLFKLEVPSYKLLGIIVIISVGVMLTVTEATDFNVIGFILVMSAAVMSGFRWTVTQLLLQKEEYGLNNPFAMMSVLTPIMSAISLILSFILEPWSKLGESKYFDSSRDILASFAIMLLGGTLAFFMVSTEYILLSETSAVTLTVAGIVKEVVTILVAVIFLKDQFSLLKGIGLAVIIVGVSLYNLFKLQKMKERAQGGDFPTNNLNGNHKYVPLKDTKAIFELGEVDEDIL